MGWVDKTHDPADLRGRGEREVKEGAEAGRDVRGGVEAERAEVEVGRGHVVRLRPSRQRPTVFVEGG